jgi:hypothetical protein
MPEHPHAPGEPAAADGAAAPAVAAVLVTAHGRLRGVDLAGPARLAVDDTHAVVEPQHGGAVTLPLARLDGARATAAYLALHAGGEVLELAAAPADAAALDAAARRIAEGACALPELTRGLRALGARRGSPGSDHDRYFAPFLGALTAARRATAPERAREVATPWRAAAAVSADDTAAALRAAISGLASSRFPERAPDRRALEAELLELAERALDALDALDAAARALAESAAEERFARWRAWSGALAAVLAAADRAWLDSVPVLADSRGAAGRTWRRVLGRDGRPDGAPPGSDR